MSTVPPSASDRLTLSRERLRQAMHEAETPRDEAPDARRASPGHGSTG